MEQFPHLNFVQKIAGKPRFHGGGAPSPRTEENKENRQGHSNALSGQTSNIKTNWANDFAKREEQSLANLDEDIIPIFIEINPDLLNNLHFDLQSFGIEIISEEEEGFIIGASMDGLRTLEEKINGFLNAEHGTGKIADLWSIIDGKREEWKPEHILSEELYEKWHNIQNDEVYQIEVSIAFDKPIGKEPDPTKQGGEARLEKYKQQLVERDEFLLKRQDNFDDFINHYGKRTSEFIELEDSFACEVEIAGLGLKDLVVNYPYVFEISEQEEVGGIEGSDEDELDFELEVLPPEQEAPEVGIIDSGFMEGHKYISPAVNSANSKSYIDGDNSVADLVKGGGHGTRVAGAVLYPDGISQLTSPYQLPCFVRNLRVLDGSNLLTNHLPAELMSKIVDENQDCSILNLSINSKAPFRKKHMSSWAGTIDTLIHENNILFLISTGNLHKNDIQYYISNGRPYPEYLNEPFCRIANPAQSSFALTIGSINHADFEDVDWKSLGGEGDVSAYSRVGKGIWGQIKPDVVGYGGGLIVTKSAISLVRENQDTSTELIRSTLHGGSAYGKDSVGTSFAAPKVSHIAAQLMKLYPNETLNLIRTLVVQGARLPNEHFQNPTTNSIRYFGYGLPSLERVTRNNEHRITFYNTGHIKAEEAHVYSLKLPVELTNPGNDFDILIEVTLSYTARVRRTRQRTKSYVATWLDWTTSKVGESFEDFKDYVLKEIEGGETDYDRETRAELSNFDWKIKNRSDLGNIQDVNRNNSTVQKDWAIIKSYQLPEEISFAVRGHKGWDKNMEEVPYALAVSIEVLGANIPIYESIRVENEIEIPIRV